MRRFAIFVALLALFFGSTAVVAQQTADPCPVELIEPKPAKDMTARLDADLTCLWRKVQELERDVTRLKHGEPANKQGSIIPSPKPPSPVVEAGIEFTADGIFLSNDRKTISANLSMKNTNEDDVLAIIVGTESKFIITNILNKSAVEADGIANCTPHSGNAASTWLCLNDDDIRWSNLNRDRIYTTHLTSTLGQPITAATADVRLRLLVKRHGEAKAYDIPLNEVEIK